MVSPFTHSTGQQTEQPWELMRREMPVVSRWVYLDHAAIGPLPERCRRAMKEWADQATEDGDIHWPTWQQKITDLRATAAELVNACPNEIAIVPHTTAGINIVAEGLEWQVGDNIVSSCGEFPTNQYAWLNLENQGVELRQVPRVDGRIDLNGIAEACDEKTRLVTLSWVCFDTGYRLDVRRAADIAHGNGALFFLDAIQGLGVFPLDVKSADIDFFSADGHKWMLGPEGTGIFFVRRNLLNVLQPKSVGWRSVVNHDDFDHHKFILKETAARYEGGSANAAGAIGLLGSLEVLKEFGLGSDRSKIGTRVLDLASILERKLSAIGCSVDRLGADDELSGIVPFDLPGHDLNQVREQLVRKKIVLSCRSGRLRAAVHAYNNDDDLERLVEAIRSVSESRSQ